MTALLVQVAGAIIIHTPEEVKGIYNMWQSRVEMEGYSVAYFNRIAAFEAPCR